MQTRAALSQDAQDMGQVLRDIIVQTGKERPNDIAFVISHYIANPATIRCTVALDGTGYIVGFQSLKKAFPGNPYDVPEGWGIIQKMLLVENAALA